MRKLKEEEMKQIQAGAVSAVAIWAIIAAGLSFFGGVLDGYTRPFKCR